MTEELPEPKSRKETYLAKAAGMDVTVPEQPESREEQYLNAIAEGGGGGGGTSNFNELTNRPKYNSAEMTGDTNIPEVIDDPFTGTDGTAVGVKGLVPAPATTDANKFLKADGTWADTGAPTVVQTTGTSQTDVMSQNAAASMVFADPGTDSQIQIGHLARASTGIDSVAIGSQTGVTSQSVALGSRAKANSPSAVAIGYATNASSQDSVALGHAASPERKGEVNIGSGVYSYGYNNSHYRVLGGVYDGQLANDAVTVGQVNSVIDAINTALSVNISHIGASS